MERPRPRPVQDRPGYWEDRTGPPKTGLLRLINQKRPVWTSPDRFFAENFIVTIFISISLWPLLGTLVQLYRSVKPINPRVLGSNLKRFHEDLTKLWQKQKYDEIISIQTRIWSYLTQFLTVFNEPELKMTGIYVGMWSNMSCDVKTGLDRLKPVFCGFTGFFKDERPRPRLQKTSS